MAKRSLPLSRVYRLLEPGPVILLATAQAGRADVMTQSWHTMMEFEPPLVGCVISDRNYSHELLRASRECTINIPTAEIARAVVGCGNASGRRLDKFRRYGLTPVPASRVGVPLIEECYAALECKLADAKLASRYCFFILEVIKAWIDPAVTAPRTLHHRGGGVFMLAGETIKLRSRAK